MCSKLTSPFSFCLCIFYLPIPLLFYHQKQPTRQFYHQFQLYISSFLVAPSKMCQTHYYKCNDCKVVTLKEVLCYGKRDANTNYQCTGRKTNCTCNNEKNPGPEHEWLCEFCSNPSDDSKDPHNTRYPATATRTHHPPDSTHDRNRSQSRTRHSWP